MPPSRDDRRLLLVTGSFLLVAAVFALGVLWVATARDSDLKGPIYLGMRGHLIENIVDESPRYYAHPDGGDGFWLDVEDGQLVALVIDVPGTKSCVVKWREQRDAYVDCNDQEHQSADLARYRLTVGSRGDSPKNSVYVNLTPKKVSPAPG
ncbi:MAG: hypothetical protein FJW86_12695 [Actinobacteria bacterium]|nr:hypothetical protein [Actinomycetota bacterium]